MSMTNLTLILMFIFLNSRFDIFARLLFLFYVVCPYLIMAALSLNLPLPPYLLFPLCYFLVIFITFLYIFFYVYTYDISPSFHPTVFYYWLGNFFSYNVTEGLKLVDKEAITSPSVKRLPEHLLAEAASTLDPILPEDSNPLNSVLPLGVAVNLHCMLNPPVYGPHLPSCPYHKGWVYDSSNSSESANVVSSATLDQIVPKPKAVDTSDAVSRLTTILEEPEPTYMPNQVVPTSDTDDWDAIVPVPYVPRPPRMSDFEIEEPVVSSSSCWFWNGCVWLWDHSFGSCSGSSGGAGFVG